MTRFKIVNGGHVNLPAEVAARWSTRYVELEDHDDHVVLRPCADEGTLPDGLGENLGTDNETSSAASSFIRRGFLGGLLDSGGWIRTTDLRVMSPPL